MSQPLGSPQKLNKKQSLSILSSSNLNRINNSHTPYHKDPSSPQKERVVSESTGLIKFSIKKHAAGVESNTLEKKPLPIFVPIDKVEDGSDQNPGSTREQSLSPAPSAQLSKEPQNNTINTQANKQSDDLLFQMASKQRQIMELKDQLKLAEAELAQLETKYRDINNVTQQKPAPAVQTPLQKVKKSTSILNFQQNPSPAQQQFARNLNQFTSNFQSTSSGLFSKGKELWGNKIKKDLKLGQDFVSQMFENNAPASDSDDSELIDDKHFDYSVDFDMDHLSNMNIEKKLKDTHLLQELDEITEEHDLSELYTDNRVVSSDDEHYGGETKPYL